jgi:3D (Asp-Asp-Asp) domain-containing protein
MTASGVRTHWGTVAADWHVYPLGTRLQIEGFPNVIFVVEDTGGGVRGNIFDVWFPDLSTAVAFGTKSLKVTVLQ